MKAAKEARVAAVRASFTEAGCTLTPAFTHPATHVNWHPSAWPVSPSDPNRHAHRRTLRRLSITWSAKSRLHEGRHRMRRSRCTALAEIGTGLPYLTLAIPHSPWPRI